jgi:hypothetical protein
MNSLSGNGQNLCFIGAILNTALSGLRRPNRDILNTVPAQLRINPTHKDRVSHAHKRVIIHSSVVRMNRAAECECANTF